MVTLVKRGAPHETETEGGVTACIRAVLNSDKACLRQLVEAGADINYASRKTGYSPLAWACRRGDLVMCHSVLATDEVSPGIPGPTGITPIMAAAAAGQKEPCNILDEWVLEHGVAGALETERLVNFQNKQGETALFYAARARNLLLCKHLLHMGAKKEMKNKAGRTAAFEARDRGFSELANWLEGTKISGKKSAESQSDRVADRKARVAEGKMALALKGGLLRGQEDKLSVAKDDDGKPGSRGGGRPGSRSRRKTGSRGGAGSRGTSRERRATSAHPDDENGRPRSSKEALALMQRDMDAEEAKAAALAKAEAQDATALVELRALADREMELMVQEKDQRDGRGHPVPLPISLDLIMKDGAPPNFETEQGTTPLMAVAYAGQAYAVRMLISEGCDVNHQNRNGRTPLMAAAAGGNVRCVIELLRAEANLGAMDNESKTAGKYASEASMFNVAKLLVNYEAAGINKALETFMSNDVTTSKRESLMVQYGCTPGDPGGEVRYDTKTCKPYKVVTSSPIELLFSPVHVLFYPSWLRTRVFAAPF
jgi:ankyrin repeat protein